MRERLRSRSSNKLVFAEKDGRWFASVTNEKSGQSHHQEDVTDFLDEIVAGGASRNPRHTDAIAQRDVALAHLKEALANEQRIVAELNGALTEKIREYRSKADQVKELQVILDQREAHWKATNEAVVRANEQLQERNHHLLAQVKSLTTERNQQGTRAVSAERENARLTDLLVQVRQEVANVLGSGSRSHNNTVDAGCRLQAALAHSLSQGGYLWPSEVRWWKRGPTNSLMHSWGGLNNEERRALLDVWDAARELLLMRVNAALPAPLPAPRGLMGKKEGDEA